MNSLKTYLKYKIESYLWKVKIKSNNFKSANVFALKIIWTIVLI